MKIDRVRARRSHIEAKFLSRLGFALSKKIRKHIVEGIRESKYTTVDYKQSNTRNSFIIDDIGDRPFKVVYSGTSGDLVTVMYLNLYEKMKVASKKSNSLPSN